MNEKNRILIGMLCTPRETADYLKISVAHLARMRGDGSGPPFIKLGKGRQASIRYRMADLEQFIGERMFSNTSQPMGAMQ